MIQDIFVGLSIALVIASAYIAERLAKKNPFDRAFRKRYKIKIDPARYATVTIWLENGYKTDDIKNAVFDAAYEYPYIERIRIEGAKHYISKFQVEPMRHFEYEIVGQENGWSGKELHIEEWE